MFSSQLGRAARASTGSSLAPHTTGTQRTAAACLASSATTSLQPKQRRLSSSKASSAPNGSSNGAKPLANTAEPERPAATKTNTGRRGSGRRARDVKKAGATDLDGAFEGLPKVAGTGHLQPQDISLSSFFSLHRPLSLTTPLPPLTTQESFASLFDPKAKRAPSQSPQDVIYTLSSAIDSLDGQTDASLQQQQQQQQQQDAADLHWQIIQESSSNADEVKHLDGPPRAKTLEEMVAQLGPFATPPPPVPAQAEKKAKKSSISAEAAEKKSFQTTITVTENTDAEGLKYYTASTSPMVRIPSDTNTTPIQDAIQRLHHGQPFLERMRERQMDYEEYRQEREEERSMMLISVKRQRKLKMKKHKYKKLMKRTRNLRRRLDRN